MNKLIIIINNYSALLITMYIKFFFIRILIPRFPFNSSILFASPKFEKGRRREYTPPDGSDLEIGAPHSAHQRDRYLNMFRAVRGSNMELLASI
jgi:hypothetical protein